ncbi:MAG: DEAD/DEAH box helicase [Propionibacteriaceae bacterium]|jgi:ATP-dependent RNA helicase HelY|nr:DEAD/DEAH box helicase [Propionibacteriaceae bacterium]
MSFEDFLDSYPFELDGFQIEACQYVESGAGVLVAAPTGSGKTIVGEFACYLAVQTGRKCFYTTPIKALSNQKFHDLVERHGEESVGLLTGDTSINGEADIVVMTTEVLRNMIYAGSSTLEGLGYVVLDEVHYLSDRFRGAAWEEVIISLPESVQVVALSATVSNAEEFGDWLRDVRGDVGVIVSEHRPVPLDQHVLAGRRIYPLFKGELVNPELVGLAKQESRTVRDDARRLRGRNGNGRRKVNYGSGRFGGAVKPFHDHLTPKREAVLEKLDSAGMLPCIYFIFSRAGCDKAVRQCLRSGLRFTDRREYDALDEIARRHSEGLSESDKDALGWDAFHAAFCRGIAAHHAGLLPALKECVEEGFVRGLVKCVFATETLALGINMPARTVVIEKLVKYNGEQHVDLTPGEYTQLTGRAGRRGIDVEGHAVVAWQSGLDPRALAGLASTRTYPLNSSFAPTYNMAVNMVATVGQAKARELLQLSFAQFQADAALERRLRNVPGRHRTKDGEPADNRAVNRARRRTNSIADRFDRICGVLESLGYLTPENDSLVVTERGRMLARIYSELDLVTAEALRLGVFNGLNDAELAAVLSTLVYEPRGDRGVHRVPTRAAERACSQLRELHRDLAMLERDFKLSPPNPPDIGFAEAIYEWTIGAELGEVLEYNDLSAGDFVRWARIVIDQADQLVGALGDSPLRKQCLRVIDLIRRGVVDISAFED